jgi:hypothetical protein
VIWSEPASAFAARGAARLSLMHAQRHIAQQPAQAERDDHHGGGSQEDRMKSDRNGRDVHGVDRGRQLLDGSGARLRGRVCAGRETVRELAAQLVREDRAEDGDADRAANEREHRQERLAFRAAYVRWLPARDDFERAEKPDVHQLWHIDVASADECFTRELLGEEPATRCTSPNLTHLGLSAAAWRGQD